MPSNEVIILLPSPLVETATSRPNSLAQVTDLHELFVLEDRIVQLIPFGEVITRFPLPLDATATKRPNSSAHTTDVHSFAAASVRLVQLIPSGDVMTLVLPAPPKNIATATKMPKESDHAIEFQADKSEGVLAVQVIPSGDVITPPLNATAANNPRLLAHVTLDQLKFAADVRDVQLIPFDDVITRLLDELVETATRRLSSGDQVTESHSCAAEADRFVQVVPFGDVMTLLVPLNETATNKFKESAHTTEFQLFAWDAVRNVHECVYSNVRPNLVLPATSNEACGVVVPTPTFDEVRGMQRTGIPFASESCRKIAKVSRGTVVIGSVVFSPR
jgi:hypothetical protein